ncbi:hypothetical protein DGWBC_0547 [Dehalogenimonas sp. WBC-2]|nr:hypothetical protein DGWBC_0547 [Dehalogenimonas sp. WBC-2]
MGEKSGQEIAKNFNSRNPTVQGGIVLTQIPIFWHLEF